MRGKEDGKPTHRPLWDVANLLPHELVQLVRTLGVRCTFVVVPTAVVEDQHGVFDEVLWGGVHVLLVLLFHRRQVHGFLDDLVVVL